MTNLSILIRLLIATFMGAAIGTERAIRKSTAGLRTFSLVCIASALTMIINEYMIKTCGMSSDPTRLSAQVISGIGFLGMGCIIVTSRNQIRGLTTAAALWATAILGLAIGAGMIIPSIITFIIIIIVVHVLSYVSHRLDSYNRILTVYIELTPGNGIKQLLEAIKYMNYDVVSMEKKKANSSENGSVAIQLDIDLKEKIHHSDIIKNLLSIDYVEYIEEIKKL